MVKMSRCGATVASTTVDSPKLVSPPGEYVIIYLSDYVAPSSGDWTKSEHLTKSRVKMATDGHRVKHVVVDSGGFIRNAPIKVIVLQTHIASE